MQDDYDDEQLSSATPWYNRTPALVGASVAGLAVIGILIAAVTFVSHHFNEPDQAPLNFVGDPGITGAFRRVVRRVESDGRTGRGAERDCAGDRD